MRLIATYILNGWDNQRIYAHIKENNLDGQYKNPIEMRHIYDTRGDLRKKGLIDKDPELPHTPPMQVKTPISPTRAQLDNPTHQIVEPEMADVETIIPSIDLETENPLEDVTEDIFELEGSIITRKTVGFTPKSLMLFDLARQKGFRGNFTDFVNSCISSALKGRGFKLVVEQEV